MATFPFDDHNAPPFEMIRPFCDDMDSFLKEDSQNVAFIHCKDGKVKIKLCSIVQHACMLSLVFHMFSCNTKIIYILTDRFNFSVSRKQVEVKTTPTYFVHYYFYYL